MQKMSFLCMIIEITNNIELNRRLINKLLNREDIQLYVEALKTYKNFESLCQNIKSINVLLENRKLVNEKIYFQNFSS